METEKPKHKLRLKDFVPFIGAINYAERNNMIPDPLLRGHPYSSDDSVHYRHEVLFFYNLVVLGGVAMSVLGLEKLLN